MWVRAVYTPAHRGSRVNICAVAGNPSTPLAKKLGIVEDSVLVLVDPPDDLRLVLPPGVTVRRQLRGRADVVLAFVTDPTQLARRLERLAAAVFPSGGLWIAWPKQSSRIPTDMSDHVVRRLSLPRGLVDNKVCAVDDTWTALRMVWRREHRIPPDRR